MVATLDTGSVLVKQRAVAPGEIELASTGLLQFIASGTMIFGSYDTVLGGNGTALLTAASHPGLSPMVRGVWAAVFAFAGVLAFRAIHRPSVKNRRQAWQFIIPLWACWVAGLSFPLFVGERTNLIVFGMCVCLVNQWILTRMFIPPNSSWYDRQVIRLRGPGERP